jgi:hypothetical protein
MSLCSKKFRGYVFLCILDPRLSYDPIRLQSLHPWLAEAYGLTSNDCYIVYIGFNDTTTTLLLSPIRHENKLFQFSITDYIYKTNKLTKQVKSVARTNSGSLAHI